MLPHVFVRPGELRYAEWADFDLDKAIWKIPPHKTKMRRAHSVPLSRQALDIIAGIETDVALTRTGYAQDEMTGHGSQMTNDAGGWHGKNNRSAR